MADGDLVVADYQAEIRTTLLGATTTCLFDRSTPISGLGNSVKDQDVDLAHGDGGYAGTDRVASRIITLPILIRTGVASTAGAAFKTLNDTTWAKSATDLTLYMKLPGLGKFYLTGRPRGVAEDFSNIDRGLIRCLLTFVANSPTITYV